MVFPVRQATPYMVYWVGCGLPHRIPLVFAFIRVHLRTIQSCTNIRSQQILGNCSPESQSTTRLPPNAVSICTK